MSAVAPRGSRSLGGSRFECSVNRVGQTIQLCLDGYLDEDSKFPDLKLKPGEVIEVDFSGLLGLDTGGVLQWEQFCFLYPNNVFRFLSCPEFVVKNANFFPGFLPNQVEVESFEVKFRCEDCNASAMVSFVRDKHFAVWPGGFGRLHHSDQLQVCDCGTRHRPKMVETESKYLEFLKRTR
jgi:hypothetical protein